MSSCDCQVEIKDKEQRRVLIPLLLINGVIVSGGLVALLASPLPDLIIGFAISIVVMRGGISIFRDATAEKNCLPE